MYDERASGLRIRDWKGFFLEIETGRGLEVRNWKGVYLEKSLELVFENGD